MRYVLAVTVMSLIAACTPTSTMGSSSSLLVTARAADEAAIRELEQHQAETWSRHDIVAYAALFADDAHVVNVLGWHWRSRAELQEKLGRGFAWVFSDSTLSVDETEVNLLSDSVAVAHVRWSMRGARSPTGDVSTTPQRGIQTQVLRKQDGRWLIADFQNTNAVDERPMPLGPPR